MSRSETVFVPAHVTGFFAAKPADDPLVAGSIGAGLTLTDGVTVTVEAGDNGTVVDGEPGTIEAVERVLSAFETDVSVEVETGVPIGAGFGVSGAAALGAAFGTNALDPAPRSEDELVRLAHRADVEAGTGLGDVVAQARGGAPIRVAPGAPGHGDVDGIPAGGRVEYLTFGEMSTESVLAGDLSAINRAGETALAELRAEPSLETFMERSRRFAREAGLLDDEVGEVIDTVEDAGGVASMAMLGRTAFAPGRDLSDAGYDPTVTRITDGCVAFR